MGQKQQVINLRIGRDHFNSRRRRFRQIQMYDHQGQAFSFKLLGCFFVFFGKFRKIIRQNYYLSALRKPCEYFRMDKAIAHPLIMQFKIFLHNFIFGHLIPRVSDHLQQQRDRKDIQYIPFKISISYGE